jgi:hypothetical protein
VLQFKNAQTLHEASDELKVLLQVPSLISQDSIVHLSPSLHTVSTFLENWQSPVEGWHVLIEQLSG